MADETLTITVAGEGTAWAAIPISTTVDGSRIVGTADFDGDGDIDVIGASFSGDQVYYFANDGHGAFADPVTVGGTIDAPYDIAVGDVNGDGYVDFAIGAYNGDQIVLFVNDGSGAFTSTVIGSLDAARSPEFIDFDRDGDIDILATGYVDDKIVWYANQGDGTFGSAQLIASYDSVANVVAADFDMDGDIDIVANSNAGGTLHYFSNDGGAFGAPTALASPPARSWDIEIGDLDGDGDIDIVSGSIDGDQMLWYENLGGGGFAEGAAIATGFNGALGVEIADIDDDGDLDVVASSYLDDRVFVVVNEGSGNFSEPEVASNDLDSPWHVEFADLDGDGAGEIVVASINDDSVSYLKETDAIEVNLDVPSAITGISFGYDEGAAVEVTLSVASGTLAAAPTGGVTVDGSGTGTLMLSGTVAAINAFIAASAVAFTTASGSGGNVTLTIGIKDASTAGVETARIAVLTVNEPPSDPELSGGTVREDAAPGDVVGVLSATDPDGDELAYTLTDDAGGRFALATEGGVSELVVNGELDYGTATSHSVSVRVTDGAGNATERTFTIGVIDVAETAAGSITIDASAASAGVDFDNYIDTFLSTLTSGGFPVFDNSAAFSGEEMVVTYGTGASAQYALAHGALEYYFGTHTVWGTVETIEFGTLGSGTYDANGYLIGADVDLKITGLTLYNAQSPEAEVEATGAVHNLAVALMSGSGATDQRLALLNQQFDAYAQTFLGSAHDDTFKGTDFDDTVRGNVGDDALDGMGGTDTAVYGGGLADYTWEDNGDGTWTITDNRTGEETDGTDTLARIEYLEFADQTVAIDGDGGEDLAPTGLALSASAVAENSAAGTVVGVLSATDPEGLPLTYMLTGNAGGRFALSTVGGVTRLVVAGTLDYESAAAHTVTVKVSDGVNDVSTDFTITVGDVDETPANGAPSKPALSGEAVSEAASVGAVVGVLSATDPDGDALSYALTDSAAGKFALVTEGGVTKLVVAEALDYETATSHEVAVRVSDGAGEQATSTFTIAVTDAIEGKPKGGKVKGSGDDDTILGLGGKDKIKAGDGDDWLVGGAGNDMLDGGAGNDRLEGGGGADKLNGGKDADSFVFAFASDSTVKAKGQDVILDFSRKQGDEIDLSAIDPANASLAFSYIGKSKFGGEAGELRAVKTGKGMLLSGDIDGDGKADFAIELAHATSLKAADLVL